MVELQQTADCRASGDDTARFLRELRQLRDCAGLGQAELAARAHYPHDYITIAEIGPAAPDLPLLSAYVRGCGGTVEEWEERWRSLTNTPALPLLPTRSAGSSTAATAGARIGSVSPAADITDPTVIIAALNRVAEKIATSTPSPTSRPPWSTLSPIAQSSIAQSSIAQPSAAAAAKRDILAAPPAVTSASLVSTSASSKSRSAKTATGKTATGKTATAVGPLAATGASNEADASSDAANRAVVDRPFRMTSRTTVAALVAIAVCVIVAVLAILA
jgi:hypothetical protein